MMTYPKSVKWKRRNCQICIGSLLFPCRSNINYCCNFSNSVCLHVLDTHELLSLLREGVVYIVKLGYNKLHLIYLIRWSLTPLWQMSMIVHNLYWAGISKTILASFGMDCYSGILSIPFVDCNVGRPKASCPPVSRWCPGPCFLVAVRSPAQLTSYRTRQFNWFCPWKWCISNIAKWYQCDKNLVSCI